MAVAIQSQPVSRKKSIHADRDSEYVPNEGPDFREIGGRHTSLFDLDDDAHVVATARKSCALAVKEVKKTLSVPQDYETVLQYCVDNSKIGPFTATSGIVVPFYLNLGTNFLDKNAAPVICRMFLDFMAHHCPTGLSENERVLVVGMEVAGGIMVSQFAALAMVTHPEFAKIADFIYCRKRRKGSGTQQQLEGPQFITSRTPTSPPQRAIYVDDANSTGTSLRDAILLLKKDYNITVERAIYLVDRSADRVNLSAASLGLADPVCANVLVEAMYDLESITPKVLQLMEKKIMASH